MDGAGVAAGRPLPAAAHSPSGLGSRPYPPRHCWRRDCWASAGLPAIGHRRPGRVARGDDAQHVPDDFSLGCVVAADIGQPALVEWLVIHAVEAAGDTPVKVSEICEPKPAARWMAYCTG